MAGMETLIVTYQNEVKISSVGKVMLTLCWDLQESSVTVKIASDSDVRSDEVSRLLGVSSEGVCYSFCCCVTMLSLTVAHTIPTLQQLPFDTVKYSA
jgi:hypothetical protein